MTPEEVKAWRKGERSRPIAARMALPIERRRDVRTRVRAILAADVPELRQAATIGFIACSPDDAEGDGRPPVTEDRMVWISEDTPLGYLPEIARSALGQSWA